jgi:hypothetical protein
MRFKQDNNQNTYLKNIQDDNGSNNEDFPDAPPTISQELEFAEQPKFPRFTQTSQTPPNDPREVNPFLMNTEHLLTKPPPSPQDFEVEIYPYTASSGTHYTWGESILKVAYQAYKALKGRDHSKWLSKVHSLDDHWEAIFQVPTKLDAFEIKWINPPERFKIFFKMDDGSKYIPLTQLIEKYKKINNGKISDKNSVSLSDAFIFHKPIFAKRLRISMNKPIKQDTFGIQLVAFYEKRTTVLVRNTQIFPDIQMCLWVNDQKPKENDRVVVYSCIDALELGDNRELWVVYTDRTIRHFISRMCLGFDDNMDIVLKKCVDFDPTYRILVKTDGTLVYEGYEDKVIAAETQNTAGHNFVNRQTEITVSSQADNTVYRKENIICKLFIKNKSGMTRIGFQLQDSL